MDREDGFVENEVTQMSPQQDDGVSENPQGRQYHVEAERRKREKKGYFFSGLAVGLASALLIISCVYLVTRLQQYIKYTDSQNQKQEETVQQEQTGQYEGTFLTTEVLEKIQVI